MSQFLEIEHKFIIDQSFNLDEFINKVKALNPKGESQVEVTDTYYFSPQTKNFVVRHRFDKEIQQLTIKSLGGDPEARIEINLDLDQSKGKQSEQVTAFLKYFGVTTQKTLTKSVRAFYFADCEVVHYVAATPEKSISCIEVEAKTTEDKEAGLAILDKYESKLGLNSLEREKQSLFQLMIL